MAFRFPKLPYAFEALEPHMSRRTLEFHYGKHHKGYVDKLNELVRGKPEEKQSLEEIIQQSTGALFNNASQAWNHAFFWNCLSPDGGGAPSGMIADTLVKRFGSFDDFRSQFTTAATTLFGSGYVWLVQTRNGTLEVVQTKDAGNPMTRDDRPLLTCDVWEHAYYLDHQNLRAHYIEAFWNLVNWEFVEKRLSQKKEPAFA